MSRKLNGLRDKGTIEIKCANCDALLLCLRMVGIEDDPDDDTLTKVAVQCGFCGNSSCVQEIYGQFFAGAPNDDITFDVIDNHPHLDDVDVCFRSRSK